MVRLTIGEDGRKIEREISEKTLLGVIRVLLADGDDDGTSEQMSDVLADILGDNEDGTVEEDRFQFTDHFWQHLTRGQETLLIVLARDGGWVGSDEALDRMDELGRPKGSPRGIGGITAGLTKKYGENDLIEKKNVPGRKAYRLNPKYREELMAGLKEHSGRI